MRIETMKLVTENVKKRIKLIENELKGENELELTHKDIGGFNMRFGWQDHLSNGLLNIFIQYAFTYTEIEVIDLKILKT